MAAFQEIEAKECGVETAIVVECLIAGRFRSEPAYRSGFFTQENGETR